MSNFNLFIIFRPLTLPSSATPKNTFPPEELAKATKSFSMPDKFSLNSIKYPSPSLELKQILFHSSACLPQVFHKYFNVNIKALKLTSVR